MLQVSLMLAVAFACLGTYCWAVLKREHRDWTSAPWCAGCGYSLAGSSERMCCPECGLAASREHVVTAVAVARRSQRLRRGVLFISLTVLSVVGGAFGWRWAPVHVTEEESFGFPSPWSGLYAGVQFWVYRDGYALRSSWLDVRSRSRSLAFSLKHRYEPMDPQPGTDLLIVHLDRSASAPWRGSHVRSLDSLAIADVEGWMASRGIDPSDSRVSNEARFLFDVLKSYPSHGVQHYYEDGPFNWFENGRVKWLSLTITPGSLWPYYLSLAGFVLVLAVLGWRRIGKTCVVHQSNSAQ